MNASAKRILYWTPRIFCILFAVFLSLFALDVFNESYSFGKAILALLIHLIPTFIIVISLIIAWRKEWFGAILFFCAAIVYIVSSRGEGWIIFAPVLSIGLLFLLDWFFRARHVSQ